MRKLLILSLMFGTFVFVVPSAEAKTATAASADQQINMRIGQPRRGRSVIRTRIIRIGRYRYRETIRITYMRNGRTRTQVISRVRLGRWGTRY